MVLMGFINNAALLLALIVIYEISYVLPKKWAKFLPAFNGLLIGMIGLAVMMLPYSFGEGLFFDTRTVLIGISALTFGTTPTIIASCILIIFRVLVGGIGLSFGVLMIVTSACIGIFWRRYLMPKKDNYRWINIYLFGVVVHLAMLVDAFALPLEVATEVLKDIAFPVLLVYPISTVLLSLLILRQKERKDTLHKVLEAEERYTSMFNNSLAVILLIDPAGGKILDANLAAEHFYGWTIEELKTMNISEINVLPVEELKSEMQKSATRQKSHFLFRHRRASGEITDVEVYSGPIRIDDFMYIFSIIHDISKRKRAEQEIIRLNTELEQRVVERTEVLQETVHELESFAHTLSHDLKSPLRAIDAYSRIIMEDHPEEVKGDLKEMVKSISHISKDMIAFTNKLLQYSTATRLDLYLEEIDLNKLFLTLFNEQAHAIPERKITLIMETHLPIIKGDQILIKQVLQNILSNAIKFTKQMDNAIIKVGHAIEEKEIVIHVNDNGVGFSMASSAKLFVMFQRLHSADEFEGTGIGLATIKKIINKHGGRTWILGKPGKGATIYFTLPIEQELPHSNSSC